MTIGALEEVVRMGLGANSFTRGRLGDGECLGLDRKCVQITACDLTYIQLFQELPGYLVYLGLVLNLVSRIWLLECPKLYANPHVVTLALVRNPA